MLHTSSTLAPYQHTCFTPDTIVFFGFPSCSEGDYEAERFGHLGNSTQSRFELSMILKKQFPSLRCSEGVRNAFY